MSIFKITPRFITHLAVFSCKRSVCCHQWWWSFRWGQSLYIKSNPGPNGSGPASGFDCHYSLIRPTEANRKRLIPFTVLDQTSHESRIAKVSEGCCQIKEAYERSSWINSGTRGIDLRDVQNRMSRALLTFQAKGSLSSSAQGPGIQE